MSEGAQAPFIAPPLADALRGLLRLFHATQNAGR